MLKGIVIAISGGIIAIVIFSLAVITIADTGGGALVVTYRYLNSKFVEPLRRQLRQEGREAGREEGAATGAQQANRRSREWYARQQEALAKGEPFDEPPPFIESPNGKEPAGE